MRFVSLSPTFHLAAVALFASFAVGCSSLDLDSLTNRTSAIKEVSSPRPEAEVVRMSVLVTPTNKEIIPPGTRIVVARITGGKHGMDCSEPVKDALMRRLIENANYEVLSRDELDWIVEEMERNWSGLFDSRKVEELGKLLGAAYFIVGRVAYCGLTSNWAPDSEMDIQFSIFASLQIINLKTGKVEVSSASEGNFVPRSSQLATLLNLPIEADESDEGSNKDSDSTPKRERILQFLSDIAPSSLGGAQPQNDSQPANSAPTSKSQNRQSQGDQYQVFRAAEDLANGFADNFFARPVWQTVEMWHDPTWSHSDALHLVKLGDCPRALSLIEDVASRETSKMDQRQLSQYLHNYGVTLMCANQPDRAVDKLRSAYRLGYGKTTLRMLGLAQQAQEWALRTEEDEQEEVDELMRNSELWIGN